MRSFAHLSIEEREILFSDKNQYKSLRSIARKLNRSHTTLVRELKRNLRENGTYMPYSATNLAVNRVRQQRMKAPLKNPFICNYVLEKLKLGWSPATISGRLPIAFPGSKICHETIYQHIYAEAQKDQALWGYLRLGRKRRRHKHGRQVQTLRKGRIPGSVSIELRPKDIERREEIGHWETDNIVSKQSNSSAISCTVERRTRYTLLTKLADGTAQEKYNALVRRLEVFPQSLRRTLTADNGGENAKHLRLSLELSIAVYFCHAYASWEKGTVENTNGRIRYYLPKGTDLDKVTAEQLAAIEYRLNNTPRRCLGFKTPTEAMQEALKQVATASV